MVHAVCTTRGGSTVHVPSRPQSMPPAGGRGAGLGAGPSSTRRRRGSLDWAVDGRSPSVERSVDVLDRPPISHFEVSYRDGSGDGAGAGRCG